jgi:hypothetical protein
MGQLRSFGETTIAEHMHLLSEEFRFESRQTLLGNFSEPAKVERRDQGINSPPRTAGNLNQVGLIQLNQRRTSIRYHWTTRIPPGGSRKVEGVGGGGATSPVLKGCG